MKQLTELEPQIVWRIFEQITHVPRPSKKESKIRAFIEQFARDNGLECRSDVNGNIVNGGPGATGRE